MLLPNPLTIQLADRAVKACLNDAPVPILDIAKNFVECGSHQKFVTNDPYLWVAKLVISLESYLQKLPEQIIFVPSETRPKTYGPNKRFQRKFYQNFSKRISKFPYSTLKENERTPIETLKPWVDTLTPYADENLEFIPGYYSISGLVSKPTDLSKDDLTAQQFSYPNVPGTIFGTKSVRNKLVDYFSRIKMYIVLHHKDLRDQGLRNLCTNLALDLNTLNPQAKVVDLFFSKNAESTNRSKVSRLVVWFDYLQKHLPLHLPQWSDLNTRAWKASSIFVLLERQHFRSYFFLSFLEQSDNQWDTDKHYLSAIKEINSLQRIYELTNQILVAPTAITSKIVRRKVQLKKTKSQTSTPVPLMLWFELMTDLLHSDKQIDVILSLFGLINFLTISRFNEVISFQVSQLLFFNRQIAPEREARVLAVDLKKTKTGAQYYEIPLLLDAEALNLEYLVERLKPFLKHNHLSLRELNHPKYPKMTNAIFNNLLETAWIQFLQKPTIFFDPRDTVFTSHSIRKLSAEFYLNILNFDLEYVRMLFGHKPTSRVLERVYLQRSHFQLTQDVLWKLSRE